MKKVLIIVVVLLLLVGAHFALINKTVTGWNGYSVVEKISKSYCGLIGHKMIAEGCGIAGCSYTCQRTYRDGGEPCLTSGDCQGKCELVDGSQFENDLFQKKDPAGCENMGDFNYKCSIPLSGQCQSAPPSNCGSFFERNGEMIKYNYVDCTM